MSNFRLLRVLLLALGVFSLPGAGSGAVFTTKLQAHTLPSWNDYVARVERAPAGLLTETQPGNATVKDLNPNGTNAGADVPDGYIHHWMGAILIPDATVGAVRAVLANYAMYPQIYTPDLKAATATARSASKFDVRLVMEQIENLGLHFAFDVKSKVEYREVSGETLIDSRSYLIRESDSGRAPYTDLLPEGEDHGILWRLNSYWRLKQAGTSVYAECQVLSLSRKPLFGTRDQIKMRARESLKRTLEQTRDAVKQAVPR